MAEGIIQNDIFAYRQVDDGYEPVSWSQTDYYINKTIKDRQTFAFSEGSIELIVFEKSNITSEQVQVIEEFVANPQYIKLIKQSGVTSILVNDEVPSSAPQRDDAGLGLFYADYIMLTPKALMANPHRVSDKVDRISGTLVHEFMEGVLKRPISWQFQLDWAQEFGYGFDESTGKFTSTSRPDICITDYAMQSPNEDICDSAVAYFFDHSKLYTPKEKKLASLV